MKNKMTEMIMVYTIAGVGESDNMVAMSPGSNQTAGYRSQLQAFLCATVHELLNLSKLQNAHLKQK